MVKGAYSVLVSLIALLLVSPIGGVNHNIVENHSELSVGNYGDFSRDGDYDVSLEYGEGNEGLSSVTRNEEIQNNFRVTNDGTFDDTYDLSVTWSDPDDDGWYAEPDTANVSVSSGTTKTISFTFRAPVQGVYCYDTDGDGEYDTCDYLDFTVMVTSQNSTSTASVDQRLEIDMVYAVDVMTREGDSLNGNRSESVVYVVEAMNIGETSEEFSVEIGPLPKDWTAETSVSTIDLDPSETGIFNLVVDIPNTAAENESAVIRVSVHVQQTGYDHIYGYLDTTTTVNDGRVYGVDIVVDAFSKQVIPGGHILYDLYVTNTGDEADSVLLDLGDVKDGWSSNLSQFSINLDPDETANVVLSVSCPSDSVKDDWSEAYVSVRSSNREQFSDNLTTNTSVRIPTRDVSLAVELDSLSGNPNAVVVYSMTLTNSGTDPDDFLLSIVRCDGCDAWGVSLSTLFVEDLEDGSSYDFEFHVDIPASARNTDSAVMGVVAISAGNSSISDSVDTTTSVNKIFDDRINWDGMQTLNPGDSSSFEITLVNEGNSIQSYTFDSNQLPSGWNFEDTFPYTTSALDPYGGQETFLVPFQVPNSASPGYFNFTIILVLDESGVTVDNVALSIKVEYYADFVIDVIEIESFDGPGATHVFAVDLTNNANAEDDIALHLDGLPDGWSYCISSDCVSSISVSKGQTASFELKVTSSSNEAANTVNGAFMSLVGISGLNNGITSFDTFTVYTNPVYHLDVDAPSGTERSGESGDTIPFQLSITNNGNAIDYVSLPSAMAPAGWIATFSESSFTLAPSQSKVVYLNVEIPATVYGGDNAIQAKVSSDQSGQTIDMEFVVYIPEIADVDVELKTTAGDVTAGTTGQFIVRLTNSGNTIESLSLSMEGKRASWFSLPSDTIGLEPGGYQEIIIEVNPPITQAAGEMSGTLNVTLSTDSSTTKIALPFTVLKSDAIPDEIPEEEEESLFGLPGPGLISVLLVITLLSRLRRRI